MNVILYTAQDGSRDEILKDLRIRGWLKLGHSIMVVNGTESGLVEDIEFVLHEPDPHYPEWGRMQQARAAAIRSSEKTSMPCALFPFLQNESLHDPVVFHDTEALALETMAKKGLAWLGLPIFRRNTQGDPDLSADAIHVAARWTVPDPTIRHAPPLRMGRQPIRKVDPLTGRHGLDDRYLRDPLEMISSLTAQPLPNASGYVLPGPDRIAPWLRAIGDGETEAAHGTVLDWLERGIAIVRGAP